MKRLNIFFQNFNVWSAIKTEFMPNSQNKLLILQFVFVSQIGRHILESKLQIYIVSLFWYVSWISLLKVLLQKMYTLWCLGCKNSMCFYSRISTWISTACALFFATAYGSFPTQTSQELRMLSRSLSDCESLLLNVMIQVSQYIRNGQLCH